MPATMLCLHDLATALGAYRMCLALSLARQAGPFVAAAEPVLTAFPGILQAGAEARAGGAGRYTKRGRACVRVRCAPGGTCTACIF